MITEELAIGIKDWIAKKPERRNLSLLARLSNVSYATVRRIASNEGEPTCDVAACICDVIFPRERMIDVFEKYYPRFARVINNVSYPTAVDDVTREYFSSKDHYPVIVLCCKKNGTASKEVEQILGEKGIDALNDLLEVGIIQEKDDKLLLAQDISLPFNYPLAREQMKMLLDLCRKKVDGIDGASAAQVMAEGLNKEGIEEVNELITEFIKSILMIVKDEKYKGDILWFGAWAHNVLLGEDELQ
ncbi:MAG: hypothetical protein ACOH5I_19480 [Oligoflexus sp.]